MPHSTCVVPPGRVGRRSAAWLVAAVTIAACSSSAGPSTTTPGPTSSEATAPVVDAPPILAAPSETGIYEAVEIELDVDQGSANPFDRRQFALDAVFEGPDGSKWSVPGFFDGRERWLVRFTPSIEGTWSYELAVTTPDGASGPATGTLEVTGSDEHGWLWPGDWVDPAYSPHYLAHHDGTPWFGFGHADLQMSLGGFGPDGFRKFAEMETTGENFEMWWPQWTANYIAGSYDAYDASQMELVDLVVREAEAHDMKLAFTVWIHQLLRTNSHPWGKGKWQDNGFRELVDLDGFFTDEEAWAWQENYYRYIIARWGYSTAIGMWQTVTEINGTESGDQTDPWHERVNAYFQENDPYRHPTTATKSGGQDWPTAHAVMDVPQMHVYEEFGQDPVEVAEIMARWTSLMWEREDKPNWIGEYGIRGQMTYPDTMHNANWATLASGAAITPIEWNDRSGYGTFDESMAADMARFVTFVSSVPLVQIDPDPIEVKMGSAGFRGWGLAGATGGIVWIQDHRLQGTDLAANMNEAEAAPRVEVELGSLPGDITTATPFDTWRGEWLDPIEIDCDPDCRFTAPPFQKDMAFRLDP